ncbi:LptA/OstA family protein [Glycocaulis sp.]
MNRFESLARALTLLPMVCLLAAPAAFAQTPAPDFVDISSDRQEILDQDDRALFVGNVNAIRGDTRLRADEAEAIIARSPETGQRRIERIVARGEVFYVTPLETARGDHGIYDLNEEIIILSGSVVLTQGCNVSTGQELVINLRTGISRLTGGSGRVRSLFFSEASEEAAAQREECPSPPVPGRLPARYQADFLSSQPRAADAAADGEADDAGEDAGE